MPIIEPAMMSSRKCLATMMRLIATRLAHSVMKTAYTAYQVFTPLLILLLRRECPVWGLPIPRISAWKHKIVLSAKVKQLLLCPLGKLHPPPFSNMCIPAAIMPSSLHGRTLSTIYFIRLFSLSLKNMARATNKIASSPFFHPRRQISSAAITAYIGYHIFIIDITVQKESEAGQCMAFMAKVAALSHSINESRKDMLRYSFVSSFHIMSLSCIMPLPVTDEMNTCGRSAGRCDSNSASISSSIMSHLVIAKRRRFTRSSGLN